MDFLEKNWKFLAGAATASAVLLATNALTSGTKKETAQFVRAKTCVGTGFQYAIIGDVGGTNVRLELIRINLENVEEEAVIVKEGRFDSQKTESILACIKELLAGVD